MGGHYWRYVVGLAVVVAFVVQRGETQRINNIAGPFRIILDHMEECPPDMRPARTFYHVRWTANRNRQDTLQWILNVNLTTLITADDNYTGSANVASWSSRGGWKDNAFRFHIERPCTNLRNQFPHYWRRAMTRVFNDPNRRCPFPPDFYSVRNVSTNYNIDVPPSFFYGKYRCTAVINNAETKELISCMRSYFAIAPKLRARPNNKHR